jgi:hypothetical protein
MSYIFNNQITFKDNANLDAFGRLRVSNITTLLDVTHKYDKAPKIMDEEVSAGSTSTYISSGSCVEMVVGGVNGYVVRQSKTKATYQPGKSQIFEASFSNFNLQSGVTKRVGYFTSTTASTFNTNFDGFFLESDGTTSVISFQIWRGGTNIYSANTSSWSTDEINPSSIDWSLTNLMFVDFQWLGVGRVRFGMVLNGITYIFSEYTAANNLGTVYMESPNKPIRYEARTTGSTGTFREICSQVSSEGAINRITNRFVVSSTGTTSMVTAGTKYAYIGIKPNIGYEDVSILAKQISIINTSNDNYLLTLEINPTISGAYSFTTNNDTSILQSLGDGSQTVTTSGVILIGFIGEAGAQALSSITIEDNGINPGLNIDGTQDELWVCITPLTANATFLGTISCEYYL